MVSASPKQGSTGGTGPSSQESGDSISDFQFPSEVQRQLTDLVKNVVCQ